MGVKVALLAVGFLLSTVCSASEQAFIRHVAIKIAVRHQLDPKLVLAIIQVESRGDPLAVGKSHGERGLMQLHPKYHECSSFHIEVNINCGVRYLALLKKKFEPTYGRAWFVSYNRGFRRVKSPEMTVYFQRVQLELSKI